MRALSKLAMASKSGTEYTTVLQASQTKFCVSTNSKIPSIALGGYFQDVIKEQYYDMFHGS